MNAAEVREQQIDRYVEWMEAKHGLGEFNLAREIANDARKVRGLVRNAVPAVEKWHRIVVPAKVLILVRYEFGPTWTTSAYRSTLYNAAVYEGRQVIVSRHSFNDALDFKCRDGTPKDWAQFLRKRRLAGDFMGGIGTYSSWCHIDNRGTQADW